MEKGKVFIFWVNPKMWALPAATTYSKGVVEVVFFCFGVAIDFNQISGPTSPPSDSPE